jgi:hypothetical protein
MYKVEIANTSLYKEFLAMREEVNKHKWYESEKAGYDIGFAKAVIDWTVKFKTKWLQNRKKKIND